MSCKNNNELVIPFSNSEIAFSGRIDFSQEEAAEIYWSGSSIKINFEGESIEALLKDESGDNYYNVILDNDSISILRPSKVKQYHQLASGLSKGKHTVELFKRAEWDRGKTSFYGFKINSGAKLLSKSAPKNRKIEFYGNDGVCLFKYFVDQDDPQKLFSWGMLGVNFFCFIIISLSYLYINLESIKSGNSTNNRQANDRNRRMQRKISIIIET